MSKGKSKKTKIVTGINAADLSKARPTKIPHALTADQIHSDPIDFKTIAMHLGIIALVVVITHTISLFGQFVFNDDYIGNVIAAKVGDDDFWVQLFLRLIAVPLNQSWLIASLAMDFRSFGAQPVWYHMVNVILHLASCIYFYVLVFLLARRQNQFHYIGAKVYEVPLIAASLLACHPLGAESVTYISGRAGTLVAANFFLALLGLLLSSWAIGAWKIIVGLLLFFACFSMAVWTSIEALAIPAIGLCMLFLFRPSPSTDSLKIWLREQGLQVAVLALLIPLCLFLPSLGVGLELTNFLGCPALSRTLYVASQLKSIVVYYLRCFVVPIGLTIMPPYVVSSGWNDLLTWLGAFVVLLVIVAIYRLRNSPLPAFGLCLFLLAYLPPALYAQPELTSDRRFYLPLAGLALTTSWFLSIVMDRYFVKNKIAKLVCFVLLLTALSGLTIWRNTAWLTDLRLWKATIKTNPTNTYVQAMFARSLIKAGKEKEAFDVVNAIVKVDKDNIAAHLIQGQLKLNAANNTDAEGEFSTVLTLANHQHLSGQVSKTAQLGLATALFNMNKFARAREIAVQVLYADKDNVQANLIMGKSLIALKQPLLALHFLNTGFKANQDNVEYFEPIAEASLDAGGERLVRNAYGAASKALSVAPSENATRILALAAFELSRFQECESVVDTLLEHKPDNPQYLYLKSLVVKELGKNKEAAIFRKKALRVDPKIEKKFDNISVIGRKPKPSLPDSKAKVGSVKSMEP